MKISIILGTRPEIIKFSPIIRQCELLDLDYYVLHTGQHYSYNMDRVFFEQLELPKPKYSLDVGSGTHANQTGKMMIGIEKILYMDRPDIVLVEGDTNTVLAGALTAAKLGVKVGHIEAGLRSYDATMPEEINRVLTDHCSNLLFAPTKKSKLTLLSEGIEREKIFVTGNTIVDAVYENLEISRKRFDAIDRLGIDQDYFLVTVHRQENVDSKKRFKGILTGLEIVHKDTGLLIIYPIHPRAQKQFKTFDFRVEGIKIIDPMDYSTFLQLERNAKLVLTDSGGVQEESCILNVPCVTLRDNTERPETLEVGSNMIAGTDPCRIVDAVNSMLKVRRDWKNPFGNGKAGKRIVQILKSAQRQTNWIGD
jgi:UDP-N-acetylglucosamine 2-epimerase (non-hydrolysing)